MAAYTSIWHKIIKLSRAGRFQCLRTNRSGTRSLLHLSLNSLMTNFIIQGEYQNPNPETKTQNYPKPKTPNPKLIQNPNSETQNHTQNPNPKTQMFWVGFGIVTSLHARSYVSMYTGFLLFIKSTLSLYILDGGWTRGSTWNCWWKKRNSN